MFASRIFILAVIPISKINDIRQYGLVAQLGERCVRIAEVEGSIPFESTISRKITAKMKLQTTIKALAWIGNQNVPYQNLHGFTTNQAPLLLHRITLEL